MTLIQKIEYRFLLAGDYLPKSQTDDLARSNLLIEQVANRLGYYKVYNSSNKFKGWQKIKTPSLAGNGV